MTLNLASWSNSWWKKHKFCMKYTDCIDHFEHRTSFQFVFWAQLLTTTHQTPTGGGRSQKPSFKERIKLNLNSQLRGGVGDKHLLWEARGMGTFWNNTNSYRLIILHAWGGGGGGGLWGNGTPFTYQQYKHYHFHWVCSRYFERPF